MTLEEKLIHFKEKGWKYDIQGNIYSHTGSKINTNNRGYITCSVNVNNNIITVSGHQLIWYLYHNKIPNCIKHIDGDILNNSIDNLKDVIYTKRNKVINKINSIANSELIKCDNNKFKLSITYGKSHFYLGYFNTEEEAELSFQNYIKRI